MPRGHEHDPFRLAQYQKYGLSLYISHPRRHRGFWLLIGGRKTQVFWHQSEARTVATVWNWSGKILSPGALLAVLYFSSCHIFPPVQTFPRPHYLPLGLRGRIFLGEKVIFITSKHGTTILFSHNNLILRKHIIVMTSVQGFITLGSFTLGLHYIQAFYNSKKRQKAHCQIQLTCSND